MNKHFVLRLLLLLFSFFILSSCGGTTGGGVAEFKTVTVSAQSSTPRLESDVLTGNVCPATTGTFVTDSVNFTVTSTAYPNLNGTASTVGIDSYTVSFSPANPSSPALPDLHGSTTGTNVPSGGNITIPVAVAPDTLKVSLVNDKGLQPCSLTVFEYYVTVTFDALEINTGTRQPITARLNVAFADRV
jgi:hypothetical protein